jgi:general stress protein 26
MRKELTRIGPEFVAMAHRIGMAVAATVDERGNPRTRIMQPVWVWDGASLTGWVSTSTESPKLDHVLRQPRVSITYWHPSQDTCTADCAVEVADDEDERAFAWQLFRETPPPAGFDPAVAPEWDGPDSPTFGVWRLRPAWLRVMPGTLMTTGEGEVWTWSAPVAPAPVAARERLSPGRSARPRS